MRVLHQSGQPVPEVLLLQRLLNRKLSSGPKLKEDLVFGPRTAAEGQEIPTSAAPGGGRPGGCRYLERARLKTDIHHPVRLFAQPTTMTCWSAAATMLMGNMSVGPGRAGVGLTGGLTATPTNVRLFADSMGLTMHYPQTWTVQGLTSLLRIHGPLWIVGAVPSLHAVVAGAIWGDNAPDGSATTVLIYDPWPPLAGSVYPVMLGDRVQRFPLGTLYILHR